MKIILITIFALFMSIHLPAQKFTNPVIPGDFADPTVIRFAGKYYACGTSSEWAPHYPVFESTDLINWDFVAPAFMNKPSWIKSSFWAPELYVHKGKIYMYYTARRASDGVSYIGVATTDDIKNGFRDHGCLVAFEKEAIDAFIFEDNGKLYISWKAYGLDKRPIELLCSELSADGLQLVGEPFMLLKDDDNKGLEGQYMFKKGDYYYIIYSILGCCGAKSNYAVSVARSKSFRGPYEHYEANPILQGNTEDIQSCGHGTAVETPDGKLFYLFHAYIKGEGFYNGRQGFLKELAINSDNWPYFVTGEHASLTEPTPFNQITQKAVPDFIDSFEGTEIRPEWTWNFTFSDIAPSIKNNTLFLTGKPAEDNRYGTALCLRTLKPNYEITTVIKDQPGLFTGLTLYGDKDNLVLFGKENGTIFLKQIRKGVEQVLSQTAQSGNVYLKIIVTEGCYATFHWSNDQKNWRQHTADSQKLNVSFLPPWDRAFRPGLIHIGNEKTPAEYTYCNLLYTRK